MTSRRSSNGVKPRPIGTAATSTSDVVVTPLPSPCDRCRYDIVVRAAPGVRRRTTPLRTAAEEMTGDRTAFVLRVAAIKVQRRNEFDIRCRVEHWPAATGSSTQVSTVQA